MGGLALIRRIREYVADSPRRLVALGRQIDGRVVVDSPYWRRRSRCSLDMRRGRLQSDLNSKVAMNATLRCCYAYRSGPVWEAICVDLDIATFGDSLDEVRASLATCIDMHLEDVDALPAADRQRLLRRSSLVRAGETGSHDVAERPSRQREPRPPVHGPAMISPARRVRPGT